MSLLDDVSIVVTPNGYKAGTLYSVLPTATESSELITCGDFACADPNAAWTRGTGTTISSGVANITIASSGSSALSQTGGIFVSGKRFKVTFTISNYSSGSIAVSNISPTTYRSANGTYTLDGIGAGGDFLFFSSGFVGSVDNISVVEVTNSDMDVTRATAGTRVDENGLVNYAEVLGSELLSQPVDLTTDFVANGGGVIVDADTFTSAGGTFDGLVSSTNTFEIGKTYKLIISGNTTSSGFGLYPAGGSGFYGSGFGTHYFTATHEKLWVRQQTAGTTNITSFSIKQADLNNVPRIDYTGGGCPHILSEPQRTNLETKSNGFSTWSANTNVTRTANYTLSPDGTQNATRLQFTANGSCSNITQSLGSYTISCYAKRNDSGTQSVGFFTNGSGVVNSAWSLTSDWKRFSYTFPALNAGAMGIAGNSGADVSVFGCQLEGLTSYATSYIPTSGSTVTRNQDQFTRDGISSLINSAEGVLFVEVAALTEVGGGTTRLSISDGSQDNNITIGYSATNTLRTIIRSSSSNQALMTSSQTITNYLKVAVKYKVNDFALWVNGVEVATDTSGAAPIGLNKLSFDRGDGNLNFFGKVKQLQVYKTALTDLQIESITSWTSFTEMANALNYTIY
jgi:hypothetical protein